MKKLVIIGANEFQNPLILKAKEMGYETHVFAWRDGAVGEKTADFFYPISITQVDEILEVCRKIRPDGVASIGSDLANITVAKLANALGLPGNDLDCIEKSTNKSAMRRAFKTAGIPVPFFRTVESADDVDRDSLEYPVIVKPTDRSGSRAITRVTGPEQLKEAIESALLQSFEKKAMVEGYIQGNEYSMESISYRGEHTCLAITKKFTTGNPHYIETGHLQPALLDTGMQERCVREIHRALDALNIQNGASHAEFKIDSEGNIRIIEIGSRMGGDCIGSHLVPLSTGHDFVKMVIQTAVGEKPEIKSETLHKVSAIRFIFNTAQVHQLERLKKQKPDILRLVQEPEKVGEHPVTDSGSRYGFYIMQTDSMEEMEAALHTRSFSKKIELWRTPVQEIYGWENQGNRIFMKRDDLLGFSFGGNKVRFAHEFLMDMERKHCDGMIIYGNYHSNLCRILSAACRREEIPCYMIYNRDDIQEEREDGNSRLIREMGVIPVPCRKGTISQAVAYAVSCLRERGCRPYYIYGDIYGAGNESVPMEAYVQVYGEICSQQEEMGIPVDYIFLASSTNATQSGLVAGKLMADKLREDKYTEDKLEENRIPGPEIIGISVSRNAHRGKEVMENNIRQYFEKKNQTLPAEWKDEIHFHDQWLSGGYGMYGAGIEEVISRMYRENGIALDPVYTGKGFYGMLEFLKREKIRGKNILFLHTGGTPLFFDYLTMGRGE